MTESHQAPNTSGSSEYDRELEAVDEYLEASGSQVPPINELLDRVQELETKKIPDEELTRLEEERTQEELKLLLELERQRGQKTPVPASLPKKHISDSDGRDDDDYEESFASQQETAQLREDFDHITEEFKALKAQFDLVMRERQNLPDMLNNIRADLNSQLTNFSDKMYTTLESQASKKDIQSALATIEEVRAEHSDQLKAASGYLSSEPKASSPIVNKGVSLKGKGKFKPVK